MHESSVPNHRGLFRLSRIIVPNHLSRIICPESSRPKLYPIQVLQRLQLRVEKRMEALQRVKLEGFDMVLAELQVELAFLRRVTRYLEE